MHGAVVQALLALRPGVRGGFDDLRVHVARLPASPRRADHAMSEALRSESLMAVAVLLVNDSKLARIVAGRALARPLLDGAALKLRARAG